MATIKVEPWGEGQGDHVLIDEADFNPEFHKKIAAKAEPKTDAKPKRAAKAEPKTDE